MDLLVSYYWSHFSRARREVVHVLRKFGDPAPKVERTGVIGIAIVHTSLNNREVIQRCKELFKTGFVFRFAIKWVPVDFWCETSLDSIKKAIDDNVTSEIGENETWGMKVEKRRWERYHTMQIIEHLAADINRKVKLTSPDKLIRVDVLGERTAISLLKPGEIFSTTRASVIKPRSAAVPTSLQPA
jgi:tRNA acetyltransferase TAN1